MRILLFLNVILLLISCKPEDPDLPIYSEDYGDGLYILSDQGVSFYNYQDTVALVKNNIFSSVNGISITNAKRIRILNSSDLSYLAPDKGFILGDKLYVVDINTFQLLGEVSGLENATYCEIISQNRAFVTDSGLSLVKEIDLNTFKTISEIETGENSVPSFIINQGNHSFVLNGGLAPSTKDTSIIAIKYRDLSISLAEFAGRILVGDNPISSVSLDDLGVLCRGIYSSSDPSNNTESSFFIVHPFSFNIVNQVTFPGVYNAKSLVKDYEEDDLYFTSSNGIYKLNYPSLSYSLFLNKKADVLETNVESYANTDSTNISVQMLYMNDIERPGYVFKYNTFLSEYTDSLFVSGNIIDLQLR